MGNNQSKKTRRSICSLKGLNWNKPMVVFLYSKKENVGDFKTRENHFCFTQARYYNGCKAVGWKSRHNLIVRNSNCADIHCIQWEHEVQADALISPALTGGLFELYLVQQMFRKPQIMYTEAPPFITRLKSPVSPEDVCSFTGLKLAISFNSDR